MRDREERDGDERDEPRIIVERKSSGIGPLLLGLAIGAGLALLFAPASGRVTRRVIARGARKMRKAAGDTLGDASAKAEETFAAARERVSEHVESARETIVRAPVGRAMRAGKAAAAQARQDLEKRLSETKAAYEAGARVAREGRERRARDD